MQKILRIGTDTVSINYRPNRTRRGLVSSVDVNGTPLYSLLPTAHFTFIGLTPVLNASVWRISRIIFDSIKLIKSQGEDLLAIHTADYLFNRFGGIWHTFLTNQQIIHSANLIYRLITEIWDWENANKPISIHKGTPYYFLAYSYASLGDWESAFVFVFNAIEEDRESYSRTNSPSRYKSSPAFMYATIVDNRNNLFYPYVKQIKRWILSQIRSYRRHTGATFHFSDFETRFLRKADLEDVAFLLMYELQCIIRQNYRVTRRVRKDDFSKLKNLDRMFDMCLVVDKVLEYRYRLLPRARRESLAKNIFNFFKEKRWLRGELHAGELKKEFACSGLYLSRTPNRVLPQLLSRTATVTYHGNILTKEMVPLLVIWNIRNYGGHNIRGQRVLVDKYENIIQCIMYSLFLALS